MQGMLQKNSTEKQGRRLQMLQDIRMKTKVMFWML